MAKVTLSTINLDVSIQCRATINTETVSEYAERMTEGDKFPSVVLFGTEDHSWIGDGWHRILAAKQIDFREIDADLQQGGRLDALRYALSANMVHGNRRSNADKQRCIEIALQEFKTLSDVQIAKLCGVTDKTVAVHRPVNLGISEVEKRLGADGKKRPAHPRGGNGKAMTTDPEVVPAAERNTEAPSTADEKADHTTPAATPVSGLPFGMYCAQLVVKKLAVIPKDDPERKQAFAYVVQWLEEHGGQNQKQAHRKFEDPLAEARAWLREWGPRSTLIPLQTPTSQKNTQ